MKLKVVYIISLFLIALTFSFSQDADYSLNINIEIEIEEQDENQYKFVYTDKTKVTLLSEKLAETKTFFVYENFFNETNNISVNSKSFYYYKKDIPFIIPDNDDIFISGGKLYYFGVPASVKKGESFTIEYEQEFSDITYLPVIWLENEVKYESVTLTLLHPDDIKPKFDVLNIFKDYPFEVKYIDTDETVFILKNINPIDELKYFPYSNNLLFIFMDLQKNGVSINNVTPTEFVKWYSNLTSLKPELEEADKKILSSEIESCKTPIEKLKVIYDYVRFNFRYIAEEQGQNSIVPRKPSIVLSRGYGDCKERASLVSAIARVYGIDVKMTLISGQKAAPNDFIYVNKFNHVICSYSDGNETIFFDPTAKYCEFGNLPESDIGKDALVLDLENPRLVKIKAPPQKPTVDIIIYASMDSLNKAKASIKLHNDYFSAAKHAVDELTGAKLENFMSEFVLTNLYKISLDYFIKEKEGYDFITFSADADLSDFVISSTSKKYIPKIPFILLDRDILERAKDSLGLYLTERISIDLKIVLECNSFRPEYDSLFLNDGSNDILFYSSIKDSETGNKLISYFLTKDKKEFNNKQKQEFIKFYESYLLNKPNMFILKAK